MMQASTAILIGAAVTLSAAGQLLLKAGARRLSGLGRMEFLLAAAMDVHVLAALAAWGASTLCWLYVLRTASLSRTYGVTSFTYVLVPLVSVHLFGEQVRPVHVAGMVLILAGVACVLSR